MTHEPPHVLVVDDDQDMRQLVTDILGGWAVPVETACNGVEALRKLEARRPALILLDMRMPVMDGWAFCRELDARGPRPPIVVITALDAAEHACELRAAGWLRKPFDYDRLEEYVRRYVPAPASA